MSANGTTSTDPDHARNYAMCQKETNGTAAKSTLWAKAPVVRRHVRAALTDRVQNV